MFKKMLIGATSGLAIASAVFASVGPAQATAQFGFSVGPGYNAAPAGPPQCWRWSRKYHHWSWICPPVQQYPQYYQAPDPFDLPFCCLRSDQRERHDH